MTLIQALELDSWEDWEIHLNNFKCSIETRFLAIFLKDSPYFSFCDKFPETITH